MGAWGDKPFENDAALDFLVELEEGGVDALRAALETAADTDPDDYLDVDEGSAAIAAAELVAAARDSNRASLPKDARAWVQANAKELGEEDQALAVRAVRRVLEGGSELASLWGEGSARSPWHQGVRALLRRLGEEADDAPPEPRASAAGPSLEQSLQVLLTFLAARGLRPTDAQMERIRACTDCDCLRQWLARVVVAETVEEVLAE